MNKKSRLLLIFLILSMLLLAFGCGKEKAADDTSLQTPQEESDQGVNETEGGESATPAETFDTGEGADQEKKVNKNGEKSPPQPHEYNLRIYMATLDGELLFPMTFTANTVTPATEALETLFSVPSSDFAYNPVPPGMEIDSLSIQGDTAQLSLKATQPVNLGSWYEALMVEAITRTLTQFSNVDKVVFSEASGSFPIFGHVDVSEPISYSDGINTENPPVPAGSTQLILWFPDANAMFMVPVTRVVPHTLQVAQASVNGLLQGPAPGSDLVGVFPSGTELQDIYIDNGTCFVDFNQAFLNWAGDLQESYAYYTLALTLTRYSSIDRVVVTVDGEPVGNSMSGYTTDEHPLDSTTATVNPLSIYLSIIN